MPAKPTRNKVQKPAKRRKITLDQIVEKDLEVPDETLKKVKGGGKSICKGWRCPKLVPIPPRRNII